MPASGQQPKNLVLMEARDPMIPAKSLYLSVAQASVL
jgi:hypothetical protein